MSPSAHDRPNFSPHHDCEVFVLELHRRLKGTLLLKTMHKELLVTVTLNKLTDVLLELMQRMSLVNEK